MLYHRNVNWDKEFDNKINEALDNNTYYVYSKHLKSNTDYKHNIDKSKLNTIIHKIKHKHYKAFECEIVNNKLIKFAIRTSYNYKKDISIVFMEKDNCILIKTAWLNNKKDKHFTLKKENYLEKCN